MPEPVNLYEAVSVPELRTAIRGRVIEPNDADYDAARTVFYTGLNSRPAAIVRPADARDVAQVVTAAREGGFTLAVRSGGHSPAGHSGVDDGVVIDLASLRDIQIDAKGRTAWAETGLTAGEYTTAVGAHRLVTGFGDSPSVGIGGITLGGGVGFLHRKLGLTVDSLLAAEVVTANGEILHVDERSHQDLFWAIRGGGGNFGVATRFRFRLHEVDEATGGILILPATPHTIERFINLQIEAPDSVAGLANVMLAPPMPLIPAEHYGKPILLALLVHAGDAKDGQRALAPFRALATPIGDMIRPMRYAQVYEGGGEPPRPPRIAARSFFTDGVDRAAVEAILDQLYRSSAPMRVAQFRVLGGAVARVSADATAFAHRDRPVMALTAAAYANPEDAAEHESWAEQLASEVRRGAPGAYIGFLGDEGEGRVREAYPDSVWQRLRRIKREYDPENLFRLNQNIPPAGD